jgi:hypothetical protein
MGALRWRKPLKGHNLAAPSLANGRCSMRLSWLLVAAAVAIVAISAQARARVQTHMLCWEPDIEFPVPCDEDDD